MKSNIFIPKKIKVGFNHRTDTYTGKLGYIIYNDGKTWRKEGSWESWREKYVDSVEYERLKKENYDNIVKQQKNHHKNYIESYQKDPRDTYYSQYAKMTEEEYLSKMVGGYEKYTPNLGRISSDVGIKPLEFDNNPLDGFVLNKKAGGYSTGWNHRQTYCRVYDPRGFEFEITIPNLLYILENSTSIKGKGLEGKFIYGWEGKDLILVPEDAPEFKEMVEFTNIQDLKIKKKDLKVGGVYLTSQGEKVTFLGENPYYYYNGCTSGEKKLWFYQNKSYNKYHVLSIGPIKKYIEDNPDIATLLDELDKCTSFKPKTVFTIKYSPHTEDSIKSLIGTSNYSSNYEVYIPAKKKDKYKRVYLEKAYGNTDFYLKRGHRGESITKTYKTIKELLEKHPIYKLETTKENEKQE